MPSDDLMKNFKEKLKSNKKIELDNDPNENFDIVKEEEVLEKAPLPEDNDNFVFFPQKDISTYDLARILAFSQLIITSDVFEKFPQDLQRHFTRYTEMINK